MSEQPTEPLGAGLVFEAAIPFSWQVLSSPPTPAEIAQQQQYNEDILRLIFGLDEHRPELHEEETALVQELARLDFKINLLLDLVGLVLANHVTIPEPLPVAFGSQSITWECAAPPVMNSQVRLEIYLDLKYPRPIILVGRVVSVDATADGHKARVAFEELGEPVQDWLERFIFRDHRRRVAKAKREAPQTDP